jgi:hypothetical protein
MLTKYLSEASNTYGGEERCIQVKNRLSSSVLSKNIKIKVYGTTFLSVVYGCETWSLTSIEEKREGMRPFGRPRRR